MKQFIFCLTILLSLNSFAQFQKGTRTIGFNIGSAGFSNVGADYTNNNGNAIGSEKTNRFSLSLSPSLGWFINEKVLVGGNVTVNISSSKYTSGITDDQSNGFTAGVGFFGRYYFSDAGFMPYGQAGLGVSFGSTSFEWVRDFRVTNNSIHKGTGDQKSIFNLNAGVGLGLTKMINKNVGLDFGVGYNFTNTSYSYAANNNIQYQTTPTTSDEVKTNYKYSGFTNAGSVSAGILIFLDPKK
jgi:hypothetical protein